jgi:excisionase family DNA binding protein
MEDRMLYGTVEAAKYLSVSRQTLYALVRKGILGHVQTGKGPTKIYIPKEELERYVKEQLVYGRDSGLTDAQKEVKRKSLEIGREVRSRRSKRKKGQAIPVPLENTENTIYCLNLKPRTFKVLWKHDKIQLHEVNVFNPNIAKQIATLPGFGLACYNDLETKLAKKNMEAVA